MKVKDLLREASFTFISGESGIEKEIHGVYIGDLLSWAMSHLQNKNAWITTQSNINVIAVGILNDAACIILAEGASLEDDAKKKAEQEGIPVLETNLPAFETAVKLNEWMNETA